MKIHFGIKMNGNGIKIRKENQTINLITSESGRLEQKDGNWPTTIRRTNMEI